jgi:hypothetical protein
MKPTQSRSGGPDTEQASWAEVVDSVQVGGHLVDVEELHARVEADQPWVMAADG